MYSRNPPSPPGGGHGAINDDHHHGRSPAAAEMSSSSSSSSTTSRRRTNTAAQAPAAAAGAAAAAAASGRRAPPGRDHGFMLRGPALNEATGAAASLRQNSEKQSHDSSHSRRRAEGEHQQQTGRARPPNNDDRDDDDDDNDDNDEHDPPCPVEGCSNICIEGCDRCRLHGGRRRCGAPHCKKFAQAPSQFCKSHGGGYRCNFPGCSKSAAGSIHRCGMHVQDLTGIHAAPTTVSRRCAVPDCVMRAVIVVYLCKAHGGGRRCTFSGCFKSACARSKLCAAHGGGRRCSHKGCTKSAVGSTLACVSHGGGRRCVHADCNKSARSGSDFCQAHRTKYEQRQTQQTGVKDSSADGIPTSPAQAYARSTYAHGVGTPQPTTDWSQENVSGASSALGNDLSLYNSNTTSSSVSHQASQDNEFSRAESQGSSSEERRGEGGGPDRQAADVTSTSLSPTLKRKRHSESDDAISSAVSDDNSTKRDRDRYSRGIRKRRQDADSKLLQDAIISSMQVVPFAGPVHGNTSHMIAPVQRAIRQGYIAPPGTASPFPHQSMAFTQGSHQFAANAFPPPGIFPSQFSYGMPMPFHPYNQSSPPSAFVGGQPFGGIIQPLPYLQQQQQQQPQAAVDSSFQPQSQLPGYAPLGQQQIRDPNFLTSAMPSAAVGTAPNVAGKGEDDIDS